MKVPNQFRVRSGLLASDDSYGCNGAFYTPERGGLFIMASDSEGWEHVSISRKDKKMPTWYDMTYVKGLFWSDEETVVQFLPKKSEHRSIVEAAHLWKRRGQEFELPPSYMVAPC